MIITAKGIMLRTDLSGIREIGRATQGVRIIRPDEGDRVVAVAKIASEEEDATPDEPSEEARGRTVRRLPMRRQPTRGTPDPSNRGRVGACHSWGIGV